MVLAALLFLAIAGSCSRTPEPPLASAAAAYRPANPQPRNPADDARPPQFAAAPRPHGRPTLRLLLLAALALALAYAVSQKLRRRAYGEPYDIAPLLESEDLY
jgi:hypothetical protein